MNLQLTKGTEIRFSRKHESDFDQRHAKEYLKENESYTVEKIEVEGWSSKVFLYEVPNVSFNTVMFEEV